MRVAPVPCISAQCRPGLDFGWAARLQTIEQPAHRIEHPRNRRLEGETATATSLLPKPAPIG